MKVILIFFLFISNVYADLEWKQDEFEKSLRKYNRKIEKFIQNPQEEVQKTVDHYKESFHNVLEFIQPKIEEHSSVQLMKDLYFKGYNYMNVRSSYQLFYYLSSDLKNGLNHLNELSKVTPLVGPYRQEILNKYYGLKYQMMFINPVIKGKLIRSFN